MHINYLEFFCMRHLSVIPRLFIYLSIIYSCQNGLMDIYFIHCLQSNILLLKLFQLWPPESACIWLLCPFDLPPSLCSLSTPLFSDTVRCSSLTLYLSCPSPGINHFFSKPWFLLVEVGIRTQDLGAWLGSRICNSGSKLTVVSNTERT